MLGKERKSSGFNSYYYSSVQWGINKEGERIQIIGHIVKYLRGTSTTNRECIIPNLET
jgi:hypothetical protein